MPCAEGYDEDVKRQTTNLRRAHAPFSRLACEAVAIRRRTVSASQARRLNEGVLLVLVTLVAGCASRAPRDAWTSPACPADVSVERWTSRDAPASVLTSPRYRIYTTLPDGSRRDALPQVLEGAYAQYQRLAPARAVDERPLHCFVFAERKQWEEFTTRRTG